MSKSIKQRVFYSANWVIFGQLFSQVMRLGSNLILTRLLVPEMFGVMSIVAVIMVGIGMFSNVGLLQSIVQSKRGEDTDYLNTAWTIQIIRGFVIFFLALMISGGVFYLGRAGYLDSQSVYGDTQLPFILGVVSLSAIISGFNSTYIFVLNRKLMMAKLVQIDLFSQLVGLIVMLFWAWFQRDIWALVFGGIISSIVKMLLSHVMDVGGKCRFQWDSTSVHEIFHFGKWIFLSSILGFMLNQGDRLILGGLISPELLGIYTIAFFLANSLKDIILKLLMSILFPFLSDTIRNNPNQVKSIYYNLRFKIDLVTMPVAGFLFSFGTVIVEFLYDSRYQPAGQMLEILSLSLISVGFMLADQLFMSYGKPKYASISASLMVLTLYISVPIAYVYYGLDGAILAIAINPVLKIVISMIIMKRKYFFNFYREIMMLPLIPVGYFVGQQLKLIFL
ncbi:hypothetical protein LCGC14_0480270 [marine sediment metagenome]|uniref:Polysaccharide biosynthesis protein C-terminal domain-containing protein n=1 Tax=marine sediment metagenome TaxID=412755 RepID=A0A0F9SET3_9ZZZZ|nr:hypothetical protein [Methylophaga sp.]